MEDALAEPAFGPEDDDEDGFLSRESAERGPKRFWPEMIAAMEDAAGRASADDAAAGALAGSAVESPTLAERAASGGAAGSSCESAESAETCSVDAEAAAPAKKAKLS